ncbi:MAG: polyhydroxyalkanoate synthesis repressor PhaR [Acetobacteraceae bacterium]|nr:polyhydroxyalkanoate synthesis repressor PhaR [Acetobacteraceae bacterium]
MTEPLRAVPTDGTASASPPTGPKTPPVVVKKYANRRLYNTEASSYVTLDHLAAMVKEGRDFVVYDAKTGEDITRQVLTQIIMEEESKGSSLLPIGFLRQLISFYGDNLGALVPRYLEQTMTAFSLQQEQMRQAMRTTMEGLFPFAPQLEEMGKQNMAMLERAFAMWAPFYGRSANPPTPTDPPEVVALKAELERLKTLIEEISAKKQG